MALPAHPQMLDNRVVQGVATAVCALGALSVWMVSATGLWVVPALLGADFAVRVWAGPRWSPLAQIVRRVVNHRDGSPQMVLAAPKRFAGSVGFVFCTTAVVVTALGGASVGAAVLATLTLFAFAEAAFGFCAGCVLYAQLTRFGVIKGDGCVECADITTRRVLR